MIDSRQHARDGFLTERVPFAADAARFPRLIFTVYPGQKPDAPATLFLKNHIMPDRLLVDVYRTCDTKAPTNALHTETCLEMGPLASLPWASTSPCKLSQGQAEDAGTMHMTSLELVFGARRNNRKRWEATIGTGISLTSVACVDSATEALALAQAAHGHAWWERYRKILVARLGDLTWGEPIPAFRFESADPKDASAFAKREARYQERLPDRLRSVAHPYTSP